MCSVPCCARPQQAHRKQIVALARGSGEIAQVEAEIDRIEAQTLERLAAPPDNQVQQIELLGKLMLYDKQLSVNRNEACAFCHMPETGFTGPVSEFNRTTGSYPGLRADAFQRPQAADARYAPLSPVLHYNPVRATWSEEISGTCARPDGDLGNPAAEQAEGPPINPVEMGLPDPRARFTAHRSGHIARCSRAVWGPQAFAIAWPDDVEQVCNQPGARRPTTAAGPSDATDRGRASATFDQMAQSMAGYEASAEVTAFTSKFDAVLAGKAQFTQQEQQGYDLFRGKAQCNECHRDGGPGEDPLFTDFTASNIGTPANPQLPLLR